MKRLLALALLSAGCNRGSGDMPPMPAPEGAVVLFDGTLTGWRARDGGEPRWRVDEGALVVVPGTGDLVTELEHGDGRLHVEFRLPWMPRAKGQARANSGVYLHGRYEIQLLDAWKNETEPDRTCGALYGVLAPKPGAARPPRRWQSFDIDFRAPRTDAAGVVTTSGRITVTHNGVVVIEDGAFDAPTGNSGWLGEDVVVTGPVLLQEHGSAVRFRNVWFAPAAE